MFMCVYMPHVRVVCNMCLCICTDTHTYTVPLSISFTLTRTYKQTQRSLNDYKRKTVGQLILQLLPGTHWYYCCPQIASFRLNIWVSQSSVNKASCSRKQGIIGTHTQYLPTSKCHHLESSMDTYNIKLITTLLKQKCYHNTSHKRMWAVTIWPPK